MNRNDRVRVCVLECVFVCIFVCFGCVYLSGLLSLLPFCLLRCHLKSDFYPRLWCFVH